MLSQFKKTIKKVLSLPRRSVSCSVLDRPSNVSPLSSGANALKMSTNGASMQAVSSRDLTPGGRRTEIQAGCCRSSILGIGPLSNRQTRLDQLGTRRTLRVPVCAVQTLAKRTSPPDNLSLHHPTFLNWDSFASDVSVDSSNRNSVASQQQYNTFLERANCQFAQQNQNAPDPFMEQGRSSLSARPYSQYSTSSRLLSVESIATIVDEKQNSPLNKAMESV